MMCSACGQTQNDGDFCGNCGASLQVLEQPVAQPVPVGAMPQPGAMPAQLPAQSERPPMSKGTKIGLAIAGGAVGCLLVGGGYLALQGPPIHTGDGELTNAATFLSEVESDWRSSLPSTDRTVSDDAACFYVLNGDSDVTDVIACGGVRRAGAADGAVWDLYRFSISGDPEGLYADDSSEDAVGVVRPEGELVDAEGNAASDELDTLAAPPLPTAPSGFIAVIDDDDPTTLTLHDQVQPTEGNRVITPAGDITVTSVAATDTLPGTVLSAADVTVDNPELPFAPAPGEVFRVIDLSQAARPDEWPSSSAGDLGSSQGLSILIDSGGKRTEVLSSVDWGEGVRRLIVATSPEASLIVSAAGHDQTVDLGTGLRAADPVSDTFYRSVTKTDLNKVLTPPSKQITRDDESLSVTAEITVRSVEVSPFDPDQGWATAGKMWLRVTYKGDLAMEDPYPASPSDGSTVAWLAGDVAATGALDAVGDESVLFSVPVDTTKVTLKSTMTWDAWFAAEEETVKFAQQSLTVDLPK